VRVAKRFRSDPRQKWNYPKKPPVAPNSSSSLESESENASEETAGSNSVSSVSNSEVPSASSSEPPSDMDAMLMSVDASMRVDSSMSADVSISMDVSISVDASMNEETNMAMNVEVNEVVAHEVQMNNGKLTLNVPGLSSIISTENKCCFCSAAQRNRIPFAAIFEAYIKTGIMIPQNNRSCETHLTDGKINQEVLANMKAYSKHSVMTAIQVSKWMNMMRSEIITNRRVLNFSNQNYDETVYDMFVGLTKSNFEILHAECEGMRSSKNR